MNLRELVNYIESGPTELVLHEPLRFRRRTRSNPCDFNGLVQALQSSETIITADCETHQKLHISEAEWGRLVETLGGIKGIQRLTLACVAGSLDFHPFQGFADAVENAQSLRSVFFEINGFRCPIDSAGIMALAGALRKKHAALEKWCWVEAQLEPQDATSGALDPVLEALSSLTCPNLRMVSICTQSASANAISNLLCQLHLGPDPDQWLLLSMMGTDECLAVAEAIRLGLCNVQRLHLSFNPKHGATATRVGVALANALTHNSTLRFFTFGGLALRFPVYEAFSAMLRINTSVVVKVNSSVNGDDQRLVDSHNQMCIEQRLNQVGRGNLLSPSQTKTMWMDALDKLNLISRKAGDTIELHVSCLYSLLCMNPSALFGDGRSFNLCV
jgi:hypothetical protein